MTRIVRRIGSSPAQRGSLSGSNCPDILQLDTGDYLVIGRRTTLDATQLGELGASIGDDEAPVIVPGRVVEDAAAQLAAERPPQPCAGFPDHCPNLVEVPPLSPFQGAGIRCGCPTGVAR